jgi:uncharacterized protein (DUF4415 family)
MKKQNAKYGFDRNDLPPLTPEQVAELEALKRLADKDIDYSDIPPLVESFWQNAVRNPLYRPVKTSTTIRVDADILVWLKSKGSGYQTRINEILRQAMLSDAKNVS